MDKYKKNQLKIHEMWVMGPVLCHNKLSYYMYVAILYECQLGVLAATLPMQVPADESGRIHGEWLKWWAPATHVEDLDEFLSLEFRMASPGC